MPIMFRYNNVIHAPSLHARVARGVGPPPDRHDAPSDGREPRKPKPIGTTGGGIPAGKISDRRPSWFDWRSPGEDGRTRRQPSIDCFTGRSWCARAAARHARRRVPLTRFGLHDGSASRHHVAPSRRRPDILTRRSKDEDDRDHGEDARPARSCGAGCGARRTPSPRSRCRHMQRDRTQ